MKVLLMRIVFISALILFVGMRAGPTEAAQFLLQPSTTSMTVGKSLTVTVALTGGEPTLGADMVFTYDPTRLAVKEVGNGTLYPTYNPVGDKRIDREKGTVTLSGSGGIGRPVTADGTFATITLEAVKPGQARVAVAYAAGATNQSGIIDPAGGELMRAAPSPLTLTIKDQPALQKLFTWFSMLFRKK